MAVDSSGVCQGAHDPGEVLQTRLTYLAFNLAFVVFDIVVGYLVYQQTRSLTMEVDVLGFSCEILAVTVNIIIELVKQQAPNLKKVMMLDLIGGLSSLALLVVIGFFGVYNTIAKARGLENGSIEMPATHLKDMVEYSMVSLLLSAINLSIFQWFKAKMLPAEGYLPDQLNMLSNLAHSIVDFVTNFTVLGTSLWLRFGVRQESWSKMRKFKVMIDVFGSFMVCACILVSICWLLRDILHCIARIRELSVREEKCLVRVGDQEEAAGLGPQGYGTMPAGKPSWASGPQGRAELDAARL